MPAEIRALYNKFEDTLNLGEYDNAREILQMMREKYGDENTEVRSAMLELDIGELDGTE